MQGQDAVHHITLNRGAHYSILPVLSLDGYLTVCVVEGSINGEEFDTFETRK